jgi:uncharacterized protein YggT (Ycf19 family)
MSWLSFLGSTNSFVKIVYDLTEVFLAPARKFLNAIGLSNSVVDFSAMLVVFALEVIKIIVVYFMNNFFA